MSIRQLFVLTSLALSLHVQAQVPASETITLNQALQAARENLDVALARRSVAAAQADIVSANRSPFPSLIAKLSQMDMQNGMGDGNFFTEKRVDKSIGVDWTWERGNKRELRTLSAERVAAAAQADLEDIRTQQQLATHAGFFDLLAAQERLNQVTQIQRSAVQLAASAEKRVQAGDLAAQDAARTEIEAQRAGSDVQLAELDRRRAALILWQLTGVSTSPERLQAQADWPEPRLQPAPNTDLTALVDMRADVRAAQARVLAAQAALDGSSAQKQADITWGASYDHYPGVSTGLLELRMQMPLQFGYSYQGEIGRATAQLALAQDALEKLRRQAYAELQRLQHETLSTAQRAQIYDTNILPRARKVAESSELAYSKGALSLTDLLDARRTLRATLLDALAARTDYARAAGAWQLRTQPEASSQLPTASIDSNK
jgi:outer membrane protein, heavy metal efflux system